MGDKKTLTVDKGIFLQRAERLYTYWKEDDGPLGNTECLVISVGMDENASPYSKSNSFQTWLYSCELHDTIAVLTKERITILASNKKADYFKNVLSDKSDGTTPSVAVLYRNKADKDAENFEKLVDIVKEAGSKYGYFAKDKYASDFCKEWEKKVTENGIEKVDVSASFIALFGVHDQKEIEMCKNAAKASAALWTFARKKFVDIIDNEKKIKHSRMADELEKNVSAVEVVGALGKNRNIETCYAPIVQSGGNYSFKWSTQSSDKLIHFGAITTSLGARFENYCSNVSRTLLIDPSRELEEAYEDALVAETALVEALRPGATLSAVYNAGLNALKHKHHDKLYKKELGFLCGIEFRESTMTISANCEGKVQAGMTFVVSIGLSLLEQANSKDESGKQVAILISDTVLVAEEGPNEVLTAAAKSRLKSNVIRFKEEEVKGNSDKENKELGRGKRSVLLTDVTRNKTTNEEKRKEHQRELAALINENAKKRLADQTGGTEAKKSKKSNVSYKTYEKFPQSSDVDSLQVYVDKRHDTVILPIFGIPVPFHISMIKNCSQSVEGEFTYLRVNFAHPGSQIGKESAQFPNPLSEYLKELTYRASNLREPGELTSSSNHLATAFRLIKEMQKKYRTEEAEEREKEGAVKQDKLVLSVAKANPKLKDLFVRPNIIQKRVTGSLEAHTNGFRYTSLRGDKIDVLYNNIKHAFFQPCDGEMLILLHFNLKNPVLWGKKKYSDIQFYTEVGEVTTDLGKYHHMQDRDDVQSEQMEREMRRKLNQAFQNFCDKVVRQTNEQLDFDQPFSELGFFGVPHRSSCMLKPTSSCLVNLTEWPPFVVTLDEVELVHFERVSFQLKNFDMVFVFKDYSRKTQMIQQIPMTSIDSVKEWLNSCDIRYMEGLQSLNWPKIMKTITDDPEEFFETGGWNILSPDSGDEADDEEESDSSAYDPEDSASGEEESDEDESEGDVTDEDSDEEASLGSDESSGKEWSDLEEEAAQEDKRKEIDDRGRVVDREKDRKRHGGSHKSGPPSKKRR